jgi:hypothetical protein
MLPTLRSASLAAALLSLPAAAFALPAVGDLLGTDPGAARAALAASGCPVTEFEAEKGKVEARCTETATGKAWEVYIDPATGKVTDVSDED